jgi:ADP-ribosylglycohydrolase/catechol 2,3-dioxygenase-like lactoylglutathione lyase family enzyme
MPRLRGRAVGAMLAAGCGDALGWPVEPRGSRVGGTRDLEPQLSFIDWRRREGGRWAPHERDIPAGTYSDDTQLMLAVGRSLTLGDEWWDVLTKLELPVWTLYELGGGGAVRRAAQSWAKGDPPWTGKNASRYFEAGANGVTMRVLPHAIVGAREKSFAPLAERVVADGIATHGHPRALVGALSAAYAMWTALRFKGKVDYGELVSRCLSDRESWAVLPDVSGFAPDWQNEADRAFDGKYRAGWADTVEEMTELLETCSDAMERGSLARDSVILEELGVFDREGGSGTRTAAAAIYLASRYITRPPAGLLAAAFARRADADTIASVTGALLGALTGDDWIQPLADGLLDHEYILQLGLSLVDQSPMLSVVGEWNPKLKRGLLDELERLEVGDRVLLPLFREGHIERIENPETRSSNAITIWWIPTALGQTLTITRVKKLSDRDRQRENANDDGVASESQLVIDEGHRSEARRSATRRAWTTLEVRDLEKAAHLYRDLLGLPVRSHGDDFLFLGATILLQQTSDRESGRFRLFRGSTNASFSASQFLGILIPSHELTSTHAKIADAGFAVSEILRDRNKSRFRVLDLDGHVIEVRAGLDN